MPLLKRECYFCPAGVRRLCAPVKVYECSLIPFDAFICAEHEKERWEKNKAYPCADCGTHYQGDCKHE